MEKIRAAFKVEPADFVVDEVPLYEPSGQGSHLYVRFRKVGLNTHDAVTAISRALGVSARDAGVAGLKDKQGVTTQTISVACGNEGAALTEKALGLTLPGIEILAAACHGNKLRTGHLKGNRFDLLIRDVPEAERAVAQARLIALGDHGVPNRFGNQRFGMAGDNVARARAWLAGEERGPRDPKKQRFLFSSMQSAVFNAVLDRRVAEGSWNHARLGDVLQVEASGGLFHCADVGVDEERVARAEVTPTGPMPGPKCKAALDEVATLEREETDRVFGAGFDFGKTKSLGEGTRRALRLWVKGLDVTLPAEPGTVRVVFELESGAYATTVLGEVFDFPAPVFTPRDGAAPEGADARDGAEADGVNSEGAGESAEAAAG